MAYIKDIQIGDSTYLIEPLLYTSTVLNTTNNTYTATLNNYNVISGSFIYLEISTTNSTAPKLNVNNTGAKDILYENANLQANMLIPGHIYNFIYNGTAWVVLGDLGSLPLAANGVRGGVQIGYTTDNATKNYAVQLDQEKMYVHVPWTGTSSWQEITGKPTTLAGYGITDATIVNDTLTLGPYSSTLVTSVNGDTGDITITAADLGLSNALRFIGVVAETSVYQPSDGTYGVPTIVGVQEYTPASGDVILDKDSLREYVFANDLWTLLGYTASQIFDSDSATPNSEDVPTWISRITQATDGSIQVERQTMGVLPIENGGTGASSFSANAVIISTSPSAGETMTLTSRAYSDSTSAEALVSTSTNFVTERDIYFGLPQINNLHNYTSDNGIYAPTTSGEQHQLLVSNDTGNAPVWTIAATIQSEVSTTADVAAYTTLTLGNSINVTAATAHSEGQIQLYSAATHAHIIKGTSTNTLDYTHILPNSDGVLVQTSSAGAVGGPTQPVYVNTDNTITALTFTQNRLYYSASDSSFAATNHYASATQIGLGTETLPENNSDTLYVNGTTYFVGNVKHNGFAYFANGTTYYIDDTGDARLKNLGIGDAAVSASYALNIEGDTYINGTHFFGNGTTYFIDDDAIGFFPDLRADQIRLNGDQVSFYQTENAAGDLYGSIQGIKDYMHFALSNGTTDTTPTFDFNGHLLPSTDEVGDLGSSTNRWGHLYLGTDDTYGDSYTPVYWNDGVPTEVTLVQQCAFTINSGKSGVRLTHTAITADSYVTQIVVTSGESNLNSAISWQSYNGANTGNSGYIELTCTSTVSGNVTGYIMISRGGEITATATDIT